MNKFFLILILFLSVFLTGCVGGGSGGGGGNSTISITTPEQEFFQYRLMFNEPDTATNHKKLNDIQQKVEKLKRITDDRTLADGSNYLIAIIKCQKAYLQSMKSDALEKSRYEENIELYEKSLDSLRNFFEKKPEEPDVSIFLAYTVQNYLSYKKIAGKLSDKEALSLLDEIQHHVKRVVLSDQSYTSKFSLYGKNLSAGDLEWVRVDAFLSIGMISVAKTILDTMVKEESRINFNPYYRLQKAKLFIKLKQYQEAIQILSEFRLPQMEDFPLRGLALYFLSGLYEQMEALDPEFSRDERKAVDKLRKQGEDFFSKTNLISFRDYTGELTPLDKKINTAYLYLKEGNPKSAEIFLEICENQKNPYFIRFNSLYFLKNYLLTDVFSSTKDFSGRIYRLTESIIESSPEAIEFNSWIQKEIDHLSGKQNNPKDMKFEISHVWLENNNLKNSKDLLIEVVRTPVDKGLDVSEEFIVKAFFRDDKKEIKVEDGKRDMLFICADLIKDGHTLKKIIDIMVIESDTGKKSVFSFPLIIKGNK